MIKLKSDCGDCTHSKVCRWKHNARFAMDKLKKETFISGESNVACTWEEKMTQDNIVVEFSCPDFEKKQETLFIKR